MIHPKHSVTVSRLAAAALLPLALLAGCATPARTRYVKPGTTAAARQQDEMQCLRAASRVDDEGYPLLPFEIDRPAFERCMRTRGYTASAGVRTTR